MPITQRERDAFFAMQGRLVELLLRYDVSRFRSTISERVADGLDDPQLRRYRELAVLFAMRDELFTSILPRIKRRLSSLAPREVQQEGLPPRGRIDWSRTLTASFNDRPGEPPLAVQTRQRRRHFVTPENLLTVATLLEYKAKVQKVLDAEARQDQRQALRHPLHSIIDACTRELVFPQFAGLLRETRDIVEGRVATTTADLERQVERSLAPGRNSAYDDLLAWRRRLAELPLLQRDMPDAQNAVGADPATDNRLYQIWIFFEVVDLLRVEGWSSPDDLSLAPMRVRFRIDGCCYELFHDQAVPAPVASWKQQQRESVPVPGVRPDFYLWRVDPPGSAVRDGTALIWREPGVVWDAKYYREREGTGAPALPIKRMIADLALLGEQYGVLLFAFLSGASDERENYLLRPDPVRSQTLIPAQNVLIAQLSPEIPSASSRLRDLLRALIRDAHQRLRTPAEIRCHGVFLDALTVNAHGAMAEAGALRTRNGTALVPLATPAEVALDTLLLCPKPHIGPWRMDVVSLERDCCQNAQVCHILGAGVPGIARPSRLSRLEDVAEAIRTAEGDSDERVTAATRQVRQIAQRYADLIKPNMGELVEWVRHRLDVDPLFATFPHLTNEHRATLGLARFLWQQIEHIQATNYAGPALLFTGVLEELVRATVYARAPELYDYRNNKLQRTLGTLGRTCKDQGQNWRLLFGAITSGRYWEAQVTPATRLAFDTWGRTVGAISFIRNQAAHEAHVSQAEFQELERRYFGSMRDGFGALNGLLLAWREPEHKP